MRISDWSSDVCSSDLPRIAQPTHGCGSGAGGTIAGAAGTLAGTASPSGPAPSRTWPRIGACDARLGEAKGAPPTTQPGLSITGLTERGLEGQAGRLRSEKGGVGGAQGREGC